MSGFEEEYLKVLEKTVMLFSANRDQSDAGLRENPEIIDFLGNLSNATDEEIESIAKINPDFIRIIAGMVASRGTYLRLQQKLEMLKGENL